MNKAFWEYAFTKGLLLLAEHLDVYIDLISYRLLCGLYLSY